MQMEGSSIDRLIKKGQQYTNWKSSGAHSRKHTQGRDKGMQHSAQCYKCGGPSHEWPAKCPANDATCRGCGKKGHYQRVCKSKAMYGSVAFFSRPFMVCTARSASPLFCGNLGLLVRCLNPYAEAKEANAWPEN
uniref:CCHC-type domain-containing protein n=1 Tax=Gadus morhua TaxID=8049 RepID=A0A8C5AJ92_GADMO